MGAGPLITEVIVTFCISAGILYRYGNWKRHNILVTVAVLIAWYFSFLIIFLLPLDVSSTVYRQCEWEKSRTGDDSNSTCLPPASNVSENVFPNLWRVVYWSCQFLTWLVLPLMQSYAKAGEFTVKGKLKSAVVDNAIYYGSYLLICGILLIYIAFKPGVHLDWPKIKAIASSASNTWGLLLLIGLLGYALVETPRNLWLSSKPGHSLNLAYFKVSKIAIDRSEAENSLEELLDSVKAMMTCVRPGNPLYADLEVVLSKIPLHLQQKNKSNNPAEGMISPSLKTLVNLHKQLIKALHTSRRCETQWRLAVEKAILLEDVEINMHAPYREFQHTFYTKHSFITPKIEWYWRCAIYRNFLRSMAVVCAFLSFAVVWSEVTFFNKSPVLSLFAIMLNVSKASYDYIAIEILSTIIIAYLCYCAYSTVLKIRVLNYYYLAPYHQTDEHSLIFSGMMICRLTPPMCLNFLGLIHMDSHIIKEVPMETFYTQVMGHMDVISIISDGFNIYFPMAVLMFCLATYFSLGSRFLSYLGFQQFLDDDDLAIEMVVDGKELVAREKRRKIRMEESAGRRRDFMERFGNSSSRNQDSTASVSPPPFGKRPSIPQEENRTRPPQRLFDDV